MTTLAGTAGATQPPSPRATLVLEQPPAARSTSRCSTATPPAERERITVDDGSGPQTALLDAPFDQGAWVHAPIEVAAAARSRSAPPAPRGRMSSSPASSWAAGRRSRTQLIRNIGNPVSALKPGLAHSSPRGRQLVRRRAGISPTGALRACAGPPRLPDPRTRREAWGFTDARRARTTCASSDHLRLSLRRPAGPELKMTASQTATSATVRISNLIPGRPLGLSQPARPAFSAE
jgi:hypothetical protein